MDPNGLSDSFEIEWFGENVLPEIFPDLNNYLPDIDGKLIYE